MQIRVFTIPLHGGEEIQIEMNRFLAANKVLEVEQRFSDSARGGCWSFCIRTLGVVASMTPLPTKERKDLLSKSCLFTNYIEQELKMTLNVPCSNHTDKGVPFVGYVVFKDQIRLSKRSKKRFRTKLMACQSNLTAGRWSQAKYVQHVQPLLSFTFHAQTDSYRRMVLRQTGIV